MFSKLFEILPDAEDLLNLEAECAIIRLLSGSFFTVFISTSSGVRTPPTGLLQFRWYLQAG